MFGSNLSGFHGAGSAGYASFGEWGNNWREHRYDKKPNGWLGNLNIKGLSEGFQEGKIGKSYAIPTVKKPGYSKSIPLKNIRKSISRLYDFAKKNSHLTFLISGTTDRENLNGYSHREIIKCYIEAGPIPENISFSESYLLLIQDEQKNKKKKSIHNSEQLVFRW